MHVLARLVRRYPGWIIAGIALITVVFAYGALKLRVSSDIQSFFPEDDPRLSVFNQVSDTFGSSEYVLAVVSTDDLFTVPVIRALDRLTRALESVPGVASVRSITNVENVRGTPWGIEVAPIMEALPETEEDVERFRERVLGDERVAERFVSDDQRHTLLLVQVARTSPEQRDAVVADIREVAARESQGLTVRLTGHPALTQLLNESMRRDILRLLPPVLVVILAVLYFSFRNVEGVVLPFAGVTISVVWTLGLMGYLGVSLSQLGSAIPVVLTSVGSAYGIHVLRRYEEEWRRLGDSGLAAEQTVSSVGAAVVMSGLTTVVGFVSNAFTSIVRIREFGVFMGFGVGVALLVAVLFIPAVLTLTRKAPRAPGKHPGPGTAEARSSVLEGLIAFVNNRPRAVFVIAGALVLAASVGLARLEVDTDYLNFFRAESEPRQAYSLVQEKFGGVDTVQIVLEGEVLEPEVLRAMEALQAELDGMPQLTGSISVVDLVKEVGQALHEDDPSFAVIPDTRAAVAQYLLLLSMSGDSMLEQFLTMDQRMAKIEVPVATTSSKERKEVLSRIETLAESRLGPFGDVTVTGLPYLVDGMAEMITGGQVRSLALSLAGVLVLLWLLVGSLTTGLLCLVPILVTILVNFGVMGWAGMTFDVVTALVASIAVGVGIDYSIHVYNRYQEGVRTGKPPREAVAGTLSTTGRAVLLNAAAVAAGFLVLLFSTFPPLGTFGFLIALTMGVSSAAALSLLPALLVAAGRPAAVRRKQLETESVRG